MPTHETKDHVVKRLDTSSGVTTIIIVVQDGQELFCRIEDVVRDILTRLLEGSAIAVLGTSLKELIGILILVVRDSVDTIGEEVRKLLRYRLGLHVAIKRHINLLEAIQPIAALLEELLARRSGWQRDARNLIP